MNVKIFSTVGTPNTKGSLMLNNDEGIASFPRDLNLLFLQTKFKLNSLMSVATPSLLSDTDINFDDMNEIYDNVDTLNSSLTILSPWIPKNQNTTVNNTIINIDGKEAVAEIKGEKIVNTKLVKPLFVKTIHN